MTSEQWSLVKSVFEKLEEVHPSERSEWLRKRVELPPTVVAEVLRLLDASESITKDTALTPHQSVPASQLIGYTLLDQFEVVSHLGCGAMGDVYCAFDRKVNEAVAFKTIRPHLAQRPELLAALAREVALSHKVVHENVCQIRDLHHEWHSPPGPLLFFTMELLPGRTLANLLAEGLPSLNEALEIARGIANGLSAIHARSLIHRDLKPSNVFLVRAENQALRPVITDFGLCFDESRPVAETITAFGPEAIVGTVAYMSCEQLLGKGATQQSDIYAFGVLLFEMATGRLPFVGETSLAIALRRLQNEAPEPRSIVKDLPEEWNSTILACLNRDPTKRPLNACDVIAALEGKGKLPRKGMPRRAFLAAAGAAASVAGGVFFWPKRASSVSPEAEHLLKLAQTNQITKPHMLSTIAELKQALTIEPNYVSAWADLADAYCMASTYNYIPSSQSLPLAADAANHALALDAHQGKALGALAYVQACDLNTWPRADATFARAIDFDKNCASSYSWYAGFLGRRCEFDRAVSMATKAHWIEPTSTRFTYRLGTEYLRARRFNDLRVLMLDSLDHEISSSSYCLLARAYEWLKQFPKADEMLQQADKYGSPAANRNFWATLYAAQGRVDQARELCNAIGKDWQNNAAETNVYLYALGALYALKRDEALMATIAQVIDEAIRRRDETVLGAASNVYLEPYRSHQKLKPLLERLHLPVA